MTDAPIIKAINKSAIPLNIESLNIENILKLIGDKRIVLIGDASHGTHEFYEIRAKITQKLIEEKGFNAVAIEGDWPDAYQVNRYIHGRKDLLTASDALSNFKKFPIWMWRNTVISKFIDWLRDYNETIPDWLHKVRFYGLDLYSIHSSIDAVIKYLKLVNPEAQKIAIERYNCFELHKREPEAYGQAAFFNIDASCEKQAKEQLLDLQRHAFEYVKNDALIEPDEYFYAEQNARLVQDAEAYYRSLFVGDISSWNTRDIHMAETLEVLERHLNDQLKEKSKIVIWAHNSHVGDARATEMGQHRGEINIGQLARERYKEDTFLLGLATYNGTVTAASNWGSFAEKKNVRPALEGSYEALFHEVNYKNFLLNFKDSNEANELLSHPRLERFIGVIYRPETERWSHYYHADITKQLDACIFLDKTKALTAFEINSEWEQGELPDTYPLGM